MTLNETSIGTSGVYVICLSMWFYNLSELAKELEIYRFEEDKNFPFPTNWRELSKETLKPMLPLQDASPEKRECLEGNAPHLKSYTDDQLQSQVPLQGASLGKSLP